MPLSIRPLFGRTLACAVAGLALSLSVPAFATPLTFTFSGAFNGSFQLDSNPVVILSSPGDYFYTDYTSGTGDFGSPRSLPGNIAFATTTYGNNNGFSGFTAEFYTTTGGGTYDIRGPQLFGGSTEAPVFSSGTFSASNYYTGQPGTLTISGGGGSRGPGAPAPEIGAGWLAGLATLAAFALTRLRFGRGRFAAA